MSIFVERAIKDAFLKKIHAGKVIVLLGARRVGKTLFVGVIVI